MPEHGSADSPGGANEQSPPRPRHLDDAPGTQTHVLALTKVGGVSKYWYYERAVNRFLRAKKVPAQDLDDLANEALLILHSIAPKYDRTIGKFRNYFMRCLSNLVNKYWRERYRLQGEVEVSGQDLDRLPAECTTPDLDLDDPVVEDRVTEDLLLRGRLAETLNLFLQEENAVGVAAHQKSLEIMMRWLFGGTDGRGMRQADLASEIGVSDRQVRTHLQRASERMVAFLESRLGPDGVERILATPGLKEVFSHHDADLRESTVDLRNLFRSMSDKKRGVIRCLFTMIPDPPDPTS